MDASKYLTTCSQCSGTGKQFKESSFSFFRKWRVKLGLSQPEVCEAVGISDKTQLSKFERGHISFSAKRMDDLADYFWAIEEKQK